MKLIREPSQLQTESHRLAMAHPHLSTGHVEFDQFLARSRPHLQQLAEKEMPANRETKVDISSVIHETVAQACEQFKQFIGSTDAEFAVWLREILRNQIVALEREHARQTQTAVAELSVSSISSVWKGDSDARSQSQVTEGLQIAIRELPEQYRTVVMLRQVDDLTFEQIGQRIHRDTESARLLWGQAILHLAKKIKIDE